MMNECNLYLINKHAPQCFKSAHSAALRLSASAGFDIESKRVATADLGNFNWICIRNGPKHTHTTRLHTHARISESLLPFFGLANAFGPHINLFLIYLCMREYAGPACFSALRLFDLRIKLHKRPGKVRRGSLAKGEEWQGKQEEGQEAGGAGCIAIVIHTGQIRLVYNGAHTTTSSLLLFPIFSVSVWPLIHLLLHCRQKRRVVSSIWVREEIALLPRPPNQSTDESTTLSASSVSFSLSHSLSLSVSQQATHSAVCGNLKITLN